MISMTSQTLNSVSRLHGSVVASNALKCPENFIYAVVTAAYWEANEKNSKSIHSDSPLLFRMSIMNINCKGIIPVN